MGQKALAVQLDVSRPNTFDTFFGELEKSPESKISVLLNFDFLINNAGTGVAAGFTETSEEQFDEMINVQFKGPFFFTQKALNHMNDGGGIVNVSSGLTRIIIPYYPVYASVKAAMENLTKYLAKDLGVST
jgi:NAD(P)-dependent dehydrogenase (short-subunit alcohol dehydrogenase family)